MFNFFDMMDNYEDRKIDNYQGENFEIDTCRVTDASSPYETAIKHELFNDGKWIVIEEYDTAEEAQQGHDQWVDQLNNTPVDQLVLKDVSTSETAELCNIFWKDEDKEFKKD